jgi:hypothetical protein
MSRTVGSKNRPKRNSGQASGLGSPVDILASQPASQPTGPAGSGILGSQSGESALGPIASGRVQPASASQAQTEATQIVVEGGQPLTPEEEEKRVQRARKSHHKKVVASGGDTQTVLMLITILDGLAVAAIGPEAALLPFEREMIEGPASRILARMDAGAREAVDKWSDPVTLIIGLGFWGSRLAGMQAAREKANSKPAPTLEFKAPPPVESSPVEFVVTDSSAGPNGASPSDIRALVFSSGINDSASVGQGA